MAKKPTSEDVFLNLPFDPSYEKVFLALIAGTTALGLTPRSVLQLPTTKDRLDRLMGVIGSCRYSIHDLSRIQLSLPVPKCPRFNMPFELGLAIAWHSARTPKQKHHWIVLESVPYRLQRSLSDLNGYDHYIHERTAIGTLRALTEALENELRPVSIDKMLEAYRLLEITAAELRHQPGYTGLFTRSSFNKLVLSASYIAKSIV